MSKDIASQKAKAATWFEDLRNQITQVFEALDRVAGIGLSRYSHRFL